MDDLKDLLNKVVQNMGEVHLFWLIHLLIKINNF